MHMVYLLSPYCDNLGLDWQELIEVERHCALIALESLGGEALFSAAFIKLFGNSILGP